jgi:hypothetical protein
MAAVNRIAAILAAAWVFAGSPSAARAAAVEGLYEGVVAGDMTETGRAVAATDALRQVVIRLTGRRTAGADPALASIYAEAPRLVQTFRSGSAGQVVVAFDPPSLEARLGAAGQRVWSRERPATLVVIVPAAGGPPARLMATAAVALRKDLGAAAQARGLPLAWPNGLPSGIEEARYQDAVAGRLELLLDLARQFGADGVLVGRLGPAGGPAVWSYLGTAGEVALGSSGVDAIQELADRYGSQLASAPAEAGRLVAAVRGVHDLAGYAAVALALAAVPNVRSVTLEQASGATVRFRLAFDGDADALRRAVRDSSRLQLDDAAPAAGEIAMVLRP